MLTGKYTSAKSIIDSMFNQYGFNPLDIHELDIYEHIYDAMGLMGSTAALVNKIAIIDIVDHRGILPCDIYAIDHGGVRDFATKKTFEWNDNIYYQVDDTPITTEEILPAENRKPIVVDGTTTYIKDFDPATPAHVEIQIPQDTLRYVYHLNNEYIVTGFATCTIEMAYQAFPSEVCCDVLVPLIPDNIRYILGVKSYVAERIGFFLWNQGKITDKRYEKLEQERLWYIGSGSNAAAMPSLDRMENIKNNSLSLVQDLFHHKRGFRNLGQRRRF